VGEKLAITSPKAQTTRDRIVGIRTDGAYQMVFLDAPGLLVPQYELHGRMRATAVRALRDADVIVHLADATYGLPESLGSIVPEALGELRAPVIVALNKADLLSEAAREAFSASAPSALLISAETGDGLDSLVNAVGALLPEGPFLYPAEDLSTQPLRFFVAEIVREVALEQLEDEVPYSIACSIEEFREDRTPVYIRATLYVERETQKRILIGAGGARIRQMGSVARPRIEHLVGSQVYLDLWVKVLPHWRREPHILDRLGYRTSR